MFLFSMPRISLYKDEGYGLPLAEALTQGVPVVASDLPIFREVAGKGALYFETTNPGDFALKVRQLGDADVLADVVARLKPVIAAKPD